MTNLTIKRLTLMIEQASFENITEFELGFEMLKLKLFSN